MTGEFAVDGFYVVYKAPNGWACSYIIKRYSSKEEFEEIRAENPKDYKDIVDLGISYKEVLHWCSNKNAVWMP